MHEEPQARYFEYEMGSDIIKTLLHASRSSSVALAFVCVNDNENGEQSGYMAHENKSTTAAVVNLLCLSYDRLPTYDAHKNTPEFDPLGGRSSPSRRGDR